MIDEVLVAVRSECEQYNVKQRRMDSNAHEAAAVLRVRLDSKFAAEVVAFAADEDVDLAVVVAVSSVAVSKTAVGEKRAFR